MTQSHTPKVTVIVPNYNHGRFLNQRIESVINQSFVDYELILLDDASTDDSIEVMAKFAGDARVRMIVRNDKNTGIPFRQWNRGIAEACGDYVWIAESDDYADNRFLATLVPILDRYPSVGLAYCQSTHVDDTNQIIGSLKGWTDDIDARRWDSNYFNSGRDECSRYVVRKCTIPNASAVVLRRAIYEQIGRADEDFRLAGDWMLWAKMLMASDIAYVAEPLNYFRVHQNTVRAASARTGIALRESMRVFKFIRDHVPVAPDVTDDVFEGLLGRWIAASSSLQLGLSESMALYRDLHSLDSRLNQRMMSRLVRRMSTRVAGDTGSSRRPRQKN